ncbi:hypothetical protein XbC2_50 [Xanthomonas phage XbC2]|nr:hypothetical protein XbC2_50 [Xanthomonas phage XbC2]
MNTSHSGYLKAITGVVLIRKDGTDMLCCVEDLTRTKHFTIGQIFNAVRVLYGKSVEQYGKLWPHYKDENENISNDWKALSQAHENCDTDYEFLVEACKQLNEEVPEIVAKAEVEKRIQMLKDAITEYTAE